MKRKFPFWPVLLSLVAVCIIGSIMRPLVNPARQNVRRARCQSELKSLAQAVGLYAKDYDEKFPQVALGANGAFGWADAIGPYLKTAQPLQCIAEERTAAAISPRAVGYTDYWMNQRMAGVFKFRLAHSASTILAGEGNDGTDATDARYALDSLPREWFANPESPPFRHLDGANYAFADGHVKWFQADRMKDTTQPSGYGHVTFAIK